jgi:hypothetical protein
MMHIVKLRSLDVVGIATAYTLHCALIIYSIGLIFKPAAE